MYHVCVEEDEYLLPGSFPLKCPICGEQTPVDCVDFITKDEGYGMCESYSRCPECRKRVDSWEFTDIDAIWDELGDDEFKAIVFKGIKARYTHRSVFQYGEKR